MYFLLVLLHELNYSVVIHKGVELFSKINDHFIPINCAESVLILKFN